MTREYDLIVVGVGTAGLPLATFAALRGARVCAFDSAPEPGGCLLINRGQLSGAGTRLQAARGIVDSPDLHYADAMRISHGTSDPTFLRLAVDLQGAFIDWLMDNGFEMEADMPRVIHGHEAYSIARTYWGKDEGRSILAVLLPLFEEQVENGRIELHLSTPVGKLVTGPGGQVCGVELEDGSRFTSRQVVLATGGYGANPELFARLHGGARLWSGSYHHAMGTGLQLAEKLGAEIVHTDKFTSGFGGFLDNSLQRPRYRSFGGLTPQDRPPWEIVVNRHGQRFYPEDLPSADERARLLSEQPDRRAWVVFDRRILEDAPNLFHYFSEARSRAILADPACTACGETLEELADRAGIDRAGLRASVEQYNAAHAGGTDPLGRSFIPRAIEVPPFYAVSIHAYTVRTVGGVRIDSGFRVLRRDGSPVPGLYAVGEVLGSLISGAGAVGGMSVTPALVFGKLLGERLLPV